MKPKVENIRLPMVRYSFRSGWALATVDGKRMKLHTSWHASTEPSEHEAEVRALFEAGKGEPVEA